MGSISILSHVIFLCQFHLPTLVSSLISHLTPHKKRRVRVRKYKTTNLGLIDQVSIFASSNGHMLNKSANSSNILDDVSKGSG